MAPGSSAGSSLLAKAASVACRTSSFDFPASTNLVFIRKIGTKVLVAAALKQCGARNLGFQKFGLSVAAPQPRSTRHMKPFLPGATVLYPSLVSTITSASPEMDGGAAVRASAISAFWSAIRYSLKGAIAG